MFYYMRTLTFPLILSSFFLPPPAASSPHRPISLAQPFVTSSPPLPIYAPLPLFVFVASALKTNRNARTQLFMWYIFFSLIRVHPTLNIIYLIRFPTTSISSKLWSKAFQLMTNARLKSNVVVRGYPAY